MKDMHYTTDGHAQRMRDQESLERMGDEVGLVRDPMESDADFRDRIRRYLSTPRSATQQGLEFALESIPGVHSATLVRTDYTDGIAPTLRFEVRVPDNHRRIEQIRTVMGQCMPAGIAWVVEVFEIVTYPLRGERMIATVTGPV